MIGKPVIASITMGIFAATVYRVLESRGSIATLAAVAVGALMYAALLILLRALNESDLEFIPGGRRLANILLRGDREEAE